MKEAYLFEWPPPREYKHTLPIHDETSVVDWMVDVSPPPNSTLRTEEPVAIKPFTNLKLNDTKNGKILNITEKVIPDDFALKKGHTELVVFRNITELGIHTLDIDTRSTKEPRNFQREIRIRDEGEVLRSLQDALGTKPTKKEWDMLLTQIEYWRETLLLIQISAKPKYITR